jgi:molecular chaperone HscB
MSNLFSCYHCKNQHEIGALFCLKCNYIQPVTISNYFALLGVAVEFDLDLKLLERNYLKLQQLLHPDQFVTKTKPEQILSLKHSALLNNAYDILKNNLSRSEYLLAYHNIIINRDEGNNLDPEYELLEEIMEFRTMISETETIVALEELDKINQQNKAETIKRIAGFFGSKNYYAAAKETIRLRYLNKIMQDLDLKLTMLEQ